MPANSSALIRSVCGIIKKKKEKRKRLKGFSPLQRMGVMQWHNKWITGADIGVRKPSAPLPPTGR